MIDALGNSTALSVPNGLILDTDGNDSFGRTDASHGVRGVAVLARTSFRSTFEV